MNELTAFVIEEITGEWPSPEKVDFTLARAMTALQKSRENRDASLGERIAEEMRLRESHTQEADLLRGR